MFAHTMMDMLSIPQIFTANYANLEHKQNYLWKDYKVTGIM